VAIEVPRWPLEASGVATKMTTFSTISELLAVTPNPERQSSLAGRGTMTKTIAGGCYLAVQPPSIRMSVPVIKLAHSEQR
jgi:hypothetical protein